VRAWRYDLVTDEPLPNPDDDDYEVERELFVHDPVWSADLELLAELILDGDGHPALRVTDFWANPVETAMLRFGEGVTPTAYTFSGDGETLYAAVSGHAAPVWSWLVEHLLEALDTREVPIAEFEFEFAVDNIQLIQVGIDSPWLACAKSYGPIVLADLSGDKSSRTLTPRQGNDGLLGDAVVLSRRCVNKVLAIDCGRLSVWDIDSQVPLTGRIVGVTAAAFTPDGGVIAATVGGDVVFLDPVSSAETRRLDFGVGPLWGVAVAADGLTAAVGAANGRAVIFDLD
jgi:WD40 repeat protein